MKNKIYTASIISLLTAIILLAGVFYWQTKQSEPPASSPQSQTHTSLPPSSENEIATTTPPFVVKGEISRGNPNKKQIIFTFDAGAGINSTQKILETAQKHNLKLTFFSTGKFAEKNPETIREIASASHEIFNHTYSHPYLTQIPDDQIKEELNKADQIISQLTGISTKPYFRPPYGDRNSHVLEVAQSEDYQSVYWTLDALDWEVGRTEQETKDRIYSSLKNGEIILMHVGDDITGNILDEVFTHVESQGYKIVSLSEGVK